MKKQLKPAAPPPEDASPEPTATIRISPADALEHSEISLDSPESEAGSGSEWELQNLDEFRTTDIDLALLPEPRPVPSAPAPIAPPTPSSRTTMKLWLGLVAVTLVAVGLAAYGFLLSRPREPISGNSVAQSPTQARAESVPPELRSYLDQAKGGNAQAMHMIALMYWNGLNIRQDRVKGLDWYRKAAKAGDKASQAELSVIEGK